MLVSVCLEGWGTGLEGVGGDLGMEERTRVGRGWRGFAYRSCAGPEVWLSLAWLLWYLRTLLGCLGWERGELEARTDLVTSPPQISQRGATEQERSVGDCVEVYEVLQTVMQMRGGR